MNKMLRGGCAWLVLAALAIAPAACTRSDPERELRAAVAAMARSIEQREPAAFLDSVSDDFARESGAFGKQDVKRLLAGVYLRNEKINVNAVLTDVRIDGDRARAKVRVLATGGAGLLPERGKVGILIRSGAARAVAGRSTTQSGPKLYSAGAA